MPESAARLTPDSADAWQPTPPASPIQSHQNQIPEPPCIPPAPSPSNPPRAMRTSIPPAPQPAKPVPHQDRDLTESKNASPPVRSHARSAARPHRSAKPHLTAAGERPRSFSLPAESKSPSMPPALPYNPPAAPVSAGSDQPYRSVENSRPRDGPQAAASRSSTEHLDSSSPLLERPPQPC